MGIVKLADALGCHNDVDIVQEGEDGLTVDKLALKVSERSVLCQGLAIGDQRPCSPP